ncbi:hypothetical protein M0R72_20255 [Candidatus Pacearchaeota archaeon]|jgi:ribosome-binding protein aMBF1 (putative translation factor)|nr:hypothetical protein [Candidatus Pacearchaeota archaeon]
MECKICGRERTLKHFPKRIKDGTGQVLKICDECDPVDIKNLAEEVAKKIDVELDSCAYLRVR